MWTGLLNDCGLFGFIPRMPRIATRKAIHSVHCDSSWELHIPRDDLTWSNPTWRTTALLPALTAPPNSFQVPRPRRPSPEITFLAFCPVVREKILGTAQCDSRCDWQGIFFCRGIGRAAFTASPLDHSLSEGEGTRNAKPERNH